MSAPRSYQPVGGDRLGLMAGVSGAGAWTITLGSSAGGGGFLDDVVLTLTDAAGAAHAYGLPLQTSIVAFPTRGSLYTMLPGGGAGLTLNYRSATFGGVQLVYTPFDATATGAMDAFTFNRTLPNCVEPVTYAVPVFIVAPSAPPAPPTPPKGVQAFGMEMVPVPGNLTRARIGVPTPVLVRTTVALPDGAEDVLPIDVVETWLVTECVAVACLLFAASMDRS